MFSGSLSLYFFLVSNIFLTNIKIDYNTCEKYLYLYNYKELGIYIT